MNIHTKISAKNADLEDKLIHGINELHTTSKLFTKVKTDTINKIEEFKNEYKDGFKRIIKCEIDLRDLLLKYNIIKDKALTKINDKDSQNELIKYESSKVLQEVEHKFSDIYNKISEMAYTQSSFNNSKDDLEDPFQYEFQDLK